MCMSNKLLMNNSNNNYVLDSAIIHYDGINNTRHGHDETYTTGLQNLCSTKYDLSAHGNIIVKDNYIMAPNSSIYLQNTKDSVKLDNFTYETCFKANITADYNKYSWIFCIRDNRQNTNYVQTIYSKNDHKLKITIARNDSQFLCNATEPNPNKIFNMQLTYNKATGMVRGFINGELNLEETLLPNIIFRGTIYMFAWNGLYTTSNSPLYATRIHNRILTDEELKHNYILDKKRFNF